MIETAQKIMTVEKFEIRKLKKLKMIVIRKKVLFCRLPNSQLNSPPVNSTLVESTTHTLSFSSGRPLSETSERNSFSKPSTLLNLFPYNNGTTSFECKPCWWSQHNGR